MSRTSLFALAATIGMVTCLLCAFTAHADNNSQQQGGPIYLPPREFEELLKPHKLALVLFKDSSAENPESNEIMEAFAAAQPQLDALNPPVKLAYFNVNEDGQLKMKYGIFKTPTLKMFRNGEEIHRPYNGGVTDSEDIVSYLTRHSEQPSVEVTTLEEAQSYVPSKEGGSSLVVIFGFFKKVDLDLNAIMALEEEIRDIGHIVCIHASTDEIMSFYGHRHTFVIYHPTRKPALWDGTTGISEFDGLNFIANHSMLDVGTYDANTKLLYDRIDRPLFRVFTDTNEERNWVQLKYLRRRLQAFAEEFPKIRFTIADIMEHEVIARELDYGPDDVKNGAAIAVTQQQVKWRPIGMSTFDVAKIEEFIYKFLHAQVKPFLRSDIIPAESALIKPGMGLVHQVVGQNFYDVVMDTKTDVLLVLYAPWCGHCKTFLPTLDEIAASYKGDTNETPHPFKATAYPTILFGRRDHKTGTATPFEGERTKENLIKFINAHRSPSA